MDYDPSAELREFERRKRLGLLNTTPDMLSDGLEGAAAPIALEPTVGAEEVGNEEMFARQAARIKTDDYRREQALYRVAKVTGTPVAELMQQPEWAGLGEVRGDAIVPLAARAAMKQTRMDGEQERMDAWKAQMKLASSNTRANMSNAFGMLSPEQQQRVIESRMTRQDTTDPRLAMAQLDAETRRAEGQDTRASNKEIAEANRIAAERERAGVMETERLRFEATENRSSRQHRELMAQGQERMEAARLAAAAGNTAEANRHTIALAEIQAKLTELGARNRMADAQISEAERQRLAGDPAAAGRSELAAGNPTAPMAMKEASRLAAQYDSGDEGIWWLGGLDGMSDDDEANLAAAFVRDYRMPDALAREAARRAADGRRWFRKRGTLPVAPPTAPPPAGR
jgi:hypothetical protein